MTKFKKCDYCHQTAKHLTKLKEAKDLFKPLEEFTDKHGLLHRQKREIIFLCKVCYEYFFPNDDTRSKNYILDNIAREDQPKEINDLLRHKR